MSDLRAGAIRALGQRLFEIDGRRQLTNAYAQKLANESFDALLDYLEEHREEWSQAELEVHKRPGYAPRSAWHDSHETELLHLIAALRGEGTEKGTE
jgi:hypothetical protein